MSMLLQDRTHIQKIGLNRLPAFVIISVAGTWTFRDEILHRCSGPRLNHLCKFTGRSVQGFLTKRWSNFPFFHWLAYSSLKHWHYRSSARV